MIDKLKNSLNLISFLIIIFVAAIAIWYSPVLFKGYSTMNLWNNALLARNLSQFNVLGAEDALNITLPPSLVKEQAQISTEGNKLTPIVLAQIFKFTGPVSYDNLIFISTFILALTLIIFTTIVYYLFDLKTAAIFSFIYILLPFNWWYAPYNFGIYEVSLFFLSLFFLFYFLGQKSQLENKQDIYSELSSPEPQIIKERIWTKIILTILSGIFLALTGLAREAMFLIVPVLFIYLLFKKQGKTLLYIFIPFLIIISFFWLPDMISSGNSYLVMFQNEALKGEASFLTWDFLSHFYLDPYTYHFAKEEYLSSYRFNVQSADLGFLERSGAMQGILEVGIEGPSFLERIKWGASLLTRHIFRFFAIEDFGGPFIFFLFILGLFALKKKYNNLFKLFTFWIIFSFLILSFFIIAGRTHLIDFGLVVALAVALGLLFFIDILVKYFHLKGNSKFFFNIFLILLVLYSLVLSSHVLWGRIYDDPQYLRILAYAREINNLEVADEDVIAVNLTQFKINKLNYLAPKSMIVFAPETLEKLIKEDKLKSAFGEFNVKYILGYSDELTEGVLANSQVENIASNSLALDVPTTSKTKSWLLNLIR